jgi:type IV pilus assembly protein PilC
VVVGVCRLRQNARETEELVPSKPKAAQDHVIVFCRQFSTMVDAGLPAVESLQVLSSQEDNAAFRAVLQDILSSVEARETLAEAFGKHPKLFDDLFVSMVDAGESGGILDKAMRQLSDQLERHARLISQVKAAMTYPIVMGIAAIAAVALVLLLVTPFFEDLEGALPVPARIAASLTQFLLDYILYIIEVLVLCVLVFWMVRSTAKGRERWGAWVLKSPVFGALRRGQCLTTFTRITGIMLSCGVSIFDALEIAAKAVGNAAIAGDAYAARTGIAAGTSMADSLARSRVIPRMVCKMIAVGEATGALDQMLIKIADHYAAEFDQAVAKLRLLMLSLLGIVVCGLLVGMAALYLKVISI